MLNYRDTLSKACNYTIHLAPYAFAYLIARESRFSSVAENRRRGLCGQQTRANMNTRGHQPANPRATRKARVCVDGNLSLSLCPLGRLAWHPRGWYTMPWSLASPNWLRLLALSLVLGRASTFSFGSSPSGIRSEQQLVRDSSRAHGTFHSCCRARSTRSRPRRMGLRMEQPYINESEVREKKICFRGVRRCAVTVRSSCVFQTT